MSDRFAFEPHPLPYGQDEYFLRQSLRIAEDDPNWKVIGRAFTNFTPNLASAYLGPIVTRDAQFVSDNRDHDPALGNPFRLSGESAMAERARQATHVEVGGVRFSVAEVCENANVWPEDFGTVFEFDGFDVPTVLYRRSGQFIFLTLAQVRIGKPRLRYFREVWNGDGEDERVAFADWSEPGVYTLERGYNYFKDEIEEEAQRQGIINPLIVVANHTGYHEFKDYDENPPDHFPGFEVEWKNEISKNLELATIFDDLEIGRRELIAVGNEADWNFVIQEWRLARQRMQALATRDDAVGSAAQDDLDYTTPVIYGIDGDRWEVPKLKREGK